jgi:hypothetical protein
LGYWIVWIVDKADTYSVIFWDVEGLNTVTLGKSADTPFLYTGILQILRDDL